MSGGNSGGIVSESELAELTKLFIGFEGATDPLCPECRNAKRAFHLILREIYIQRVRPAFMDIDYSIFASLTRRICRARVSKEGPAFPCPQPPAPDQIKL
jgi:hypothetical protein